MLFVLLAKKCVFDNANVAGPHGAVVLLFTFGEQVDNIKDPFESKSMVEALNVYYTRYE